MKIFALVAAVGGAAMGAASAAFVPRAFVPSTTHASSTARFSTTEEPPLVDIPVASSAAKKNLLEVATRLKDEYGILLLEKTAKDDLKTAVEELENLSEPPSMMDDYKDLYLGDWTLLCLTSTNNDGIDTSRIPAFFSQDPLKKIRDSIREAANKYLMVQQCIRSTNDDGVVDRVDNILQYQPPEQVRELLDSLPEQLSNLNINPLNVSKSKLILIHKASIDEDETTSLVTKKSLQSIVLNVAGTSTVLDPNGKDVASINLPLGDFVNTGSFETTYLDDALRISRGKQGFLDQLRVFIRTDKLVTEPQDVPVVGDMETVQDAEVEVFPMEEEEEDVSEPVAETSVDDDDEEDGVIDI